MDNMIILVSIFGLIGALILQWFHKLGFKLAKVEKSEIPGFSKRFIIQIATVGVSYGSMSLLGKLFEGEGSATNFDALAVFSTMTSTMSSIIGNMYFVMLIMAFIASILLLVL